MLIVDYKFQVEEEVEESRALKKINKAFLDFKCIFATIYFVLPQIQKTLLNLIFCIILKTIGKKFRLDLNITGFFSFKYKINGGMAIWTVFEQLVF